MKHKICWITELCFRISQIRNPIFCESSVREAKCMWCTVIWEACWTRGRAPNWVIEWKQQWDRQDHWAQSWCYDSRLPLPSKKKGKRRRVGGGGAQGIGSCVDRESGRKVTNSDCHSAHSSSWRRSGITASEVINQHTSWSGPASQSLSGANWSVEEQRFGLWQKDVFGISAGKTPDAFHIHTQCRNDRINYRLM